MGAKFRSWRQQIKQHPVRLAVNIGAAMVGIALLVVLVLGYIFNWGWTGLVPYIPPNKDSNFQRGKTLWDWMQLLFIPVVLAVAGFWFNHRERIAAELQAEAQRKIAEDNQQETAMQEYINQMSELLLHANLRGSKSEDEVRNLARVRTLTILRRCNPERKGNMIKFLYESNLILNVVTIVDLNGADLSKANLFATDLSHADLSEVNLTGANLFGANLSGANLAGADLSGADLDSANLSGANMFETRLTDAILNAADVREAVLSGAVLSGAKMLLVRLSKAKLDVASMEGVDLFGADLSYTDLSYADLSYASLWNADVSCACLSKAIINESDFSGANLEEVNGITIEELKQKAKSLKGATMPDGSIHP